MAEIRITVEGKKATVAPEANIVSSNMAEMRAKMKGLVADGCSTITLDLAGVEIVDSTGIGLLIAIHNSLLKAGGTLSVINASKDILDLFKAMRLDQHFAITGA